MIFRRKVESLLMVIFLKIKCTFNCDNFIPSDVSFGELFKWKFAEAEKLLPGKLLRKKNLIHRSSPEDHYTFESGLLKRMI